MGSFTAAVVSKPGGVFELDTFRLPSLSDGQVLVRLEATGLCHADLGARSGDFPVPHPIVLGHEGCGIVEEVGRGVTTLRPGHRVVLTFDTCDGCEACRAGVGTQCADLLTRNWTGDDSTPTAISESTGSEVRLGFFGQSSFATYAIAHERNTIPVETGLAAEVLAPLGCGVQTGVGAVKNVLRPSPGDVVAVFGAGAVGMSAALALLSGGVEFVVVDPDPARRALAENLGCALTVDPGAGDPAAIIRDSYAGGLSGALECSGNPTAFTAAVNCTRTGATTAVVGAPAFGTLGQLDIADLVNSSKRIVGSVEGDSTPGELIPWMVAEIEGGRLPVHLLVRTYPFADVEEAACDMAAGSVIKPVLIFDPADDSETSAEVPNGRS